jgi:hypothetical protein
MVPANIAFRMAGARWKKSRNACLWAPAAHNDDGGRVGGGADASASNLSLLSSNSISHQVGAVAGDTWFSKTGSAPAELVCFGER